MIPFTKIQATGNDFIVFDNRFIDLKILTTQKIRFLCDRHWGIGADGLIFIGEREAGQLNMIYFNADGSEGEMCGNGLRAAACYAREENLFNSGKDLQIQARDGRHQIWFNKDQTISVEILTGKTRDTTPDLKQLPVPDGLRLVGYFNTGVPHLVLATDKSIDELNLLEFAPSLRRHPVFKFGTNVNIIQKIADNRFKVRTYERGVEAETLSCGTGVTACAMLLWQNNPHLPSELFMETKGGILKVSGQKGRIMLTGPATIVFTGKIQL